MQIPYPDDYVALRLTPTIANKNLASAGKAYLEQDDVLYFLDQIQRTLGITNPDDTGTALSRIYEIEQTKLIQNFGSANQLLCMNGGGDGFAWKSIVAGTNVTITETDTEIEIAAAGGSSDARAVTQAVTPGMAVSVSFASLGTAVYAVDGYVINSSGVRSEIIPNVPPLTDSRTATGLTIQVYDTGTLYLIAKTI